MSLGADAMTRMSTKSTKNVDVKRRRLPWIPDAHGTSCVTMRTVAVIAMIGMSIIGLLLLILPCDIPINSSIQLPTPTIPINPIAQSLSPTAPNTKCAATPPAIPQCFREYTVSCMRRFTNVEVSDVFFVYQQDLTDPYQLLGGYNDTKHGYVTTQYENTTRFNVTERMIHFTISNVSRAMDGSYSCLQHTRNEVRDSDELSYMGIKTYVTQFKAERCDHGCEIMYRTRDELMGVYAPLATVVSFWDKPVWAEGQ